MRGAAAGAALLPAWLHAQTATSIPVLLARAEGRASALLSRAARLDTAGLTPADGLRALGRAAGIRIAYRASLLPADRAVSCRCAGGSLLPIASIRRTRRR